MENLRFDKESYFNVLVSYTAHFIKEIENIFPTRYGNTRESLGKVDSILPLSVQL